MSRRTRGAASVGLIWIVLLIVILLGCVAGLYFVNADKALLEEKVRTVTKERDEQQSRVAEGKKKIIELSKLAGFRDDNDPNAETRAEQVQKIVGEIATKRALGADATTASRVLERLDTQIDELTRQLAEAKDANAKAEQARASLQANLQDVTKQKDELNDKVSKELSDERDRHGAQEATDKTRIEDLDKRLKDADARAKSEKDELEKQVAKLTEEVKVRDGRIVELSKKVEMIRLPDQPDGSVVAVSTASTCYLDLGSKQMLRRGTRFKVFNYTKNGAMHEKGMVEVTKVEDAMAEATVVDLKDRFDPIQRGDFIAAPNYDPTMPREFVLMGRFPSGYSRALVADRLRALGANVKDKVGPTTDFLVVGDKEDAAAEAAPKEGDAAAAAAPTEDDQLKMAQLYRVQIVQVRDILEFLKYE